MRVDLTEYCDHHFRYMNNQPLNFVLKKQWSILSPISNYLYLNYRIRGFFEYRLRGERNLYFLDFMFEYQDAIWVIEVDEHGHRGYDKEKDTERTRALLGFERAVNLLRINPDKYYDVVEDRVMPPVCEKVVMVLKDYNYLHHTKFLDCMTRKDEVRRRVDIVIRVLEHAFSNDGVLVGEQVLDDKVSIRRLFF